MAAPATDALVTNANCSLASGAATQASRTGAGDGSTATPTLAQPPSPSSKAASDDAMILQSGIFAVYFRWLLIASIPGGGKSTARTTATGGRSGRSAALGAARGRSVQTSGREVAMALNQRQRIQMSGDSLGGIARISKNGGVIGVL